MRFVQLCKLCARPCLFTRNLVVRLPTVKSRKMSDIKEGDKASWNWGSKEIGPGMLPSLPQSCKSMQRSTFTRTHSSITPSATAYLHASQKHLRKNKVTPVRSRLMFGFSHQRAHAVA